MRPIRVPLKLLWHSTQAEKTWRLRLEEIAVAWNRAERLSVLERIRPACQQVMSPAEAIGAMSWAHSHGLHTRMVRTVKGFDGFAHQYLPGDDLVVLGIGWPGSLEDGPDDGMDLGYPACCRMSWHVTFPHTVDPVYEWAGEMAWQDVKTYPNGQGFPDNQLITRTKRIATCPPETNPTLRYWSILLSPQVPCAWDCDEARCFAMNFRKLMGEAGEWAAELLSLPIHWSSYRGVVIVKTPLFRVIAPGDPSHIRHEVFINGDV